MPSATCPVATLRYSHSVPRKKSPGIPVPLVTRAMSEAEVLPASRLPLTRDDLHRLAGPGLLEILQETCRWTGDEPVGDHRFVVFSFEARKDVHICVQVWSQPRDAVVRVMGMVRREEEEPEDYEGRVFINHEGDVSPLGRELIDVLYQTYDYRGLAPLTASSAWVGLA